MHDVDRTLREFESEYGETEALETTGENEDFLGSLGNVVGGLFGETEAHEAAHEQFLGEAAHEMHEAQEGFLGEEELGEAAHEMHEAHESFLGEGELGEVSHEGVFDEVTEMELAAELLEISNEEELEQFLGKLVSKVGRFAKKAGGALVPILKKAAKVALPMAGAALGNLVVPGLGGVIGRKLGGAAGSMFGLELEGLSGQDREFEVARRYVRFAGTSAARLARTPIAVPPARAIRAAVIPSARRYIPGLLRPRTVAAVNNAIRTIARQAGRVANVAGSAAVAGLRPATNGRGRPRPRTYGTYGVPVGTTYGAYTPDAPATYAAGAIVPSTPTPSYMGDGGITGGFADARPAYGRTGRWYRRGQKIVLVGV